MSHKSTISKQSSLDDLSLADVASVINSLIKKGCRQVCKKAKHIAPKEPAGKKRHAYNTKFKVQVIEVCDEGATQDIVVEKFGIS